VGDVAYGLEARLERLLEAVGILEAVIEGTWRFGSHRATGGRTRQKHAARLEHHRGGRPAHDVRIKRGTAMVKTIGELAGQRRIIEHCLYGE
jgi:hypothetical protein